MTGVGSVTRVEAQELTAAGQTAQRRRRLLRLGLVGLGALFVVGWIILANFDPFSSLSPPVSTISADPGPGEWAMFRRDPAHSAFDADGHEPPRGEVKWQFTGVAPIAASPTVVDGRVYLSTGDRTVVALDSETGEQIWQHNTTGPIDSSVAVAGEMAFVGLRDGRVLALERFTGEVRWEFRTSGPIHRSPVVQGGELYIGSDDFRVYALDAMTGQLRWSYRTGGRISSSAAVNKDVVAVTSEDKHLYVIDRATGDPRMDLRLTTGTRSPVFAGTRVFAIDGAGRLTAADWREEDLPFEKTSARVGLQLFSWGLLDDVPTQRGFEWGFRPPGGGLVGMPAIARDRVYVSGSMGALFALDVSTGQPVWEFRTESRLEGSPSVVNRTVFVGDVEGIVYALDAATGEVQWQLDIGGEILSSLVVAYGAIYVTTADGGLHAIR